ncbi:hypothetical protein J4442_00325 [Candidatus Woesearchaeota archaeon]|nr:hypothetical protein [Candidatus Woesearchaeota archaeon]
MNKINTVGVSMNIVVREDKIDDRKVFVINNEELGVSDFGDTLDDAMDNFRKSAKMYLETYPEKSTLPQVL